MNVQVTKCDVCGKIKGEANKWLGAIVSTNPKGPGITICSTKILGAPSNALDICSDTCLQKLILETTEKIRAL